VRGDGAVAMARVHQVPALLGPIDDITLLDEHGRVTR
jgi:hypothetical protein